MVKVIGGANFHGLVILNDWQAMSLLHVDKLTY